MPGFMSGIHVLAVLQRSKDVDGRNKSGHDGALAHNLRWDAFAASCRTYLRRADGRAWSYSSRRLSDPAGHVDRPVPARRQHHGDGAQRRGQDVGRARAADRGGQSRRRGRHARHALCRQGRARWLHHSAELHRHDGDRARHERQCRLRSRQGFCADRHDRVRAECPGGASVAAGAFNRRVDQPCQGSVRAIAIRIARCRHGQSPCLRISCDRNGHEASARALQRQRPGHERSARRTYSDDVRADPGCARQHQGRNPACARHYQRQANEPAAGPSDARRKRRAGFRGRAALRAWRRPPEPRRRSSRDSTRS